jgi:hypothetical protein
VYLHQGVVSGHVYLKGYCGNSAVGGDVGATLPPGEHVCAVVREGVMDDTSTPLSRGHSLAEKACAGISDGGGYGFSLGKTAEFPQFPGLCGCRGNVTPR